MNDDTPRTTAAATAPSASAPGGTVEPADRARIAKERFQTPHDDPRERFELRDPFAKVTYRATSLPQMVAKAEQLGSDRFVAIDPEGKRTAVQKVDGQWQRGPMRPAAPERAAEAPVRDEAQPTNVVPMAAAKAPARPDQAPVEPTVDPMAVAKIDARADRDARVRRLEAALQERYVIKHARVTVGDAPIGRTEYRFRGDTSRVAFTESTFKLATDTNSPSVARSMVDVAEARNWKALRVSGNEDFKRLVWLEASVRGVKAIGYEPNPADLEVLKREREARQVNRIEPAQEAGARVGPGTGPSAGQAAAAPAEKGASGRGGGRKAVLAAVEAVLVDRKVPPKQREAVMAAAAEKLGQRIRDGQAPKVKVYDKAAPSQRPVPAPLPEQQRSRERAAPVR